MIKDWLVLISLWILGRFLYYVGHKTCGDVEGNYYIGVGRYTRRYCILPPAHIEACVTDWEWNVSLHKWVRFWFASDSTGTYSRTELY